MASKIIESSGNVFADIGLHGADELELKAELALSVGAVMRKRGLSQTGAALLTGISQPDLSRILRGHLKDISEGRLLRALRDLEAEIDISFKLNGEPVGETIHLEPIYA